MTTQPEQLLENNLKAQLEKLGYQSVAIKNETDLLANLKSQIELHNETALSEKDFKQILNYTLLISELQISASLVYNSDAGGEH